MSDPQNTWTPGRWLRWKLTGDPLTEHEQFCVEMWGRYAEKHRPTDLGVGRSLEWDYYSKLRQKYPVADN